MSKPAPFILIVVCVLTLACTAGAPCTALASSAGWTAHQASFAPLLSVAAADSAHAWAVGPGPTVVATSDGGTSWVAQSPATAGDLYAVAFSDAADGWAVGDVGTVVATTDGGADWSAQTAPTSQALIGVACRGQDCWAVGTGGTIMATTDGGANWAAQSSPSTVDLFSVTFADASHGWAVGDQGTILATTDGGAVWTVQNSSTGAYLNGVTSRGALRAWAVGEKGIIIATTDGGAHWIVRRPAKAHDLYTVVFADARHGWTVGVGGVILATTNRGVTWRAQPCPVREDLASVDFADTLHGFVAGTAGTMMASTHAGWSDVRPPTVAAVGAAGWHRGAVRVVLRATDGRGGSGIASTRYSLDHGKTWTKGSSFTVPAPADHSNDGAHWFLYRATDNAGNVAAARRGRVSIDTRRPAPVAKWSAAATRGYRTALRFYVSDPRPGSPTAKATIRIYDRGGKLVKKTVLPAVAVDRSHNWVFVCRLPRGTYRFTVAATDAAGNRAARVATNRLIVRG
jgi:photosystem II stability/assembly factor-like uncharacterized protein